MIGSCDCCNRQKVPISRGEVTGIETYACFICQGSDDPDPYCEMDTPSPQASATPANQKTRCEECNLLETCADPLCPNAVSSPQGESDG
jgi:hypothetical protein